MIQFTEKPLSILDVGFDFLGVDTDPTCVKRNGYNSNYVSCGGIFNFTKMFCGVWNDACLPAVSSGLVTAFLTACTSLKGWVGHYLSVSKVSVQYKRRLLKAAFACSLR